MNGCSSSKAGSSSSNPPPAVRRPAARPTEVVACKARQTAPFASRISDDHSFMDMAIIWSSHLHPP